MPAILLQRESTLDDPKYFSATPWMIQGVVVDVVCVIIFIEGKYIGRQFTNQKTYFTVSSPLSPDYELCRPFFCRGKVPWMIQSTSQQHPG
jgi:hypothetical protein